MTTPPDNPTSQTVLALAAARGILRPSDLAGTGIARATLQRLVQTGALVRLGRGLYALADADPSEHTSLAAVARKVPHGVVCLLSALRFHGMTTENPFQVWLAIDRKARLPASSGTQLRIVRFAPHLLQQGVKPHDIDGVTVRITTPARTVADCFRYRAKIGLDVALAALRSYMRDGKGTMDELWQAALDCRVANVMRPYLEAMS